MTEKESTSGVLRKRAVATVGVFAAIAAGSVALAGAADAAAPVLTNTAPATVLNQGTPSTLTLKIDNTATGNTAITGTVTLDATIPAGLNCASVVLSSATTGAPAFTLTGGSTGTCTATSAPYTAGTSTAPTYTYSLTVATAGSTATTGTLTTQFTLNQVIGANSSAVASSNTGTTAIVAPNAAVFAAAPSAAVLYQAYAGQIFATPAAPIGTQTLYTSATTTTTNSAGDPVVTYGALTATVVTGNTAVSLNDGLVLNAVTGVISRSATSSTTVSRIAPDVYYLVSNNGTGGATAPVTGTAGGSTPPTPSLILHDVASPLINIPTLFSDVAATGTFSTAIYTLNGLDVVQGFADGTYRPTVNVTRAQFAAILYRDLSNSAPPACTVALGNNPSQFPDVPYSSVFCPYINALASMGIINGNLNGTYTPNATVLRQSTAAFLYRAYAVDAGLPVSDASCTTPVPFSDVKTTNPFCGDIEFLASNGVIAGFSSTTFGPTKNVLRQEVAQFVYRFDVAGFN